MSNKNAKTDKRRIRKLERQVHDLKSEIHNLVNALEEANDAKPINSIINDYNYSLSLMQDLLNCVYKKMDCTMPIRAMEQLVTSNRRKSA